jgi:hypothetical protein
VLHNSVAELRSYAHLARDSSAVSPGTFRISHIKIMKRLLLFMSLATVLAGTLQANPRRSSAANPKQLLVKGRVYDRNHALILSSEVTAQNAAGKNFRAVADGDGAYKIELPLDEYRIEANAPGFCPQRFDLVRVQKSAVQKPLDFVLEMAQSDRPCAQQTMIKKAPRGKQGIPRSIAE